MPEAPVMPEISAPPQPEPTKPATPRTPEPAILPTLFGEGYGTYKTRPAAFVYSYGFVTALVAAFILIASVVPPVAKMVENKVTEIVLPSEPPTVGHDSGGGTHEKLPASKGVPPKMARTIPLAPPTVHKIPDPALPAPDSVIGPPKPPPMLAQLGDPLGKIGAPSNGPGSGGGIGSGSGGGIGAGHGAYRVGGGVSAPVATFQPDPEYSEEARKAKYQGEVWLTVIVGTDGRAHDIRVSRSLGLGLDEKAIESVKTWKFEPGKKDGVPVAVQISVEVAFHLL
jgi:protein TonB